METLRQQGFRGVERIGIEPMTSGLQIQSRADQE